MLANCPKVGTVRTVLTTQYVRRRSVACSHTFQQREELRFPQAKSRVKMETRPAHAAQLQLSADVRCLARLASFIPPKFDSASNPTSRRFEVAYRLGYATSAKEMSWLEKQGVRYSEYWFQSCLPPRRYHRRGPVSPWQSRSQRLGPPRYGTAVKAHLDR